LVRIDKVVLCNNEAKNTGIAKATARLFNKVSVQKNESKWSSYLLTTPKDCFSESCKRKNRIIENQKSLYDDEYWQFLKN